MTCEQLRERSLAARLAGDKIDAAHYLGLLLRHPDYAIPSLRLRKRDDPLPPWYAGRDIGELDYLPLDPLPPAWPPCECCGKPTSTLRTYAGGCERAVCHECTTMLRFAGLDLYAISTNGCDPLPANWHRLALPSQRVAGEAYDRGRLAEMTKGFPPSFWPQAARDIKKRLWKSIHG